VKIQKDREGPIKGKPPKMIAKYFPKIICSRRTKTSVGAAYRLRPEIK
jgi:hypothetical protein